MQAHEEQDAETPPSSTPLLFSLQFYIDEVALGPYPFGKATQTDGSNVLIGFQLLQYEIVLFDETLNLQSTWISAIETKEKANVSGVDSGSASMRTKLQHGKSCLFEADPKGLVQELFDDQETALALLLLERDREKARLIAFACVVLQLHVGLFDSESEMRSKFRICEWASQTGAWQLKDQSSRHVGDVTGVVTLSCLGKALAPHLTNAIGLDIRKQPRPISPKRTSSQATKESAPAFQDTREVIEAAAILDEEMKQCDDDHSPERKSSGNNDHDAVRTNDMGVQCDEYADEAISLSSLSLKSGDAILLETQHGKRGNSPKYAIRSSSKPAREGKQYERHHESPRRKKCNRPSSDDDRNLFTRELPPPLYFQKPAKKKQ